MDRKKKKKTYSKLTIVRKITVVSKYTAKGENKNPAYLIFFQKTLLDWFMYACVQQSLELSHWEKKKK